MPSTPIGQIHTATDGRDILRNDPDGWEVERPWLWWDGPADSDGTGGPWGNPPPGADDAAPTRNGTAIAAVTRCVQLTADPIAGMPWKVYRGRERVDTPTWITDPQNLAHDGRRLSAPGPDVRFSGVEFWSQTITSMLNLGEGIIYTPRVLDASGEPTGQIVAPIYNLNPYYVDLDEDTGRYYVDDELEEDGRSYLDPRELIVIRNMVRPGRLRGLGVVQAHAADLAMAANMRNYADNMYQRGIPNGYLKSEQPNLTQDQATKLRAQWMDAHGGTRKGIGVLNATTEFKPLQLDPMVGQIIDMFRLSVWQIAMAYGVPPSKFGISFGSNHTYANLEQEEAAYVNETLMRIARRIEAAIDAVLPIGQELKIDFRQLLRGDTITRFQGYQIGLATGFLTVDEVRDWEDLPPLTAAPADTTPPESDTTPPESDTTPPETDTTPAPPVTDTSVTEPAE